MTERFTLAHFRRLVAFAREHEIPPARITTYAQLRAMRRLDKKLGLRRRWKIGDYFYELHTVNGVTHWKGA